MFYVNKQCTMSFISAFLLLLFCEQLWAAFGNQQANKNGEAVGKSIWQSQIQSGFWLEGTTLTLHTKMWIIGFKYWLVQF